MAVLIFGAASCGGDGEDKKTETVEVQISPTPTAVVIEGPITVNYSYDEIGRLVQAEYSDGTTISYTYDAAGNLLKREITKP
ncbi:MAG: RHS repeat protein [Anaerolineales bacterium]|nr:RHS repeat protein [Anaerolineales bacterium]